MELMAIITVIISVVGLSITIISAWVQAEKQVNDLYDQMVKFRTEHPEVMRLSRDWKSGHFAKVYNQTTEKDKKWVIYYSYVELCIGYCNSVLTSRWRLAPGSYHSQHRPLVMLILAEHNPIIEELVKDEYISELIKGFRKERMDENIDWREAHRKLAT